MSIGGILAYLNLTINNPTTNNLLSTISLITITITSFTLTDSSHFPGYWALLPTLSSALIIQAGQQSFLNK